MKWIALLALIMTSCGKAKEETFPLPDHAFQDAYDMKLTDKNVKARLAAYCLSPLVQSVREELGIMQYEETPTMGLLLMRKVRYIKGPKAYQTDIFLIDAAEPVQIDMPEDMLSVKVLATKETAGQAPESSLQFPDEGALLLDIPGNQTEGSDQITINIRGYKEDTKMTCRMAKHNTPSPG